MSTKRNKNTITNNYFHQFRNDLHFNYIDMCHSGKYNINKMELSGICEKMQGNKHYEMALVPCFQGNKIYCQFDIDECFDNNYMDIKKTLELAINKYLFTTELDATYICARNGNIKYHYYYTDVIVTRQLLKEIYTEANKLFGMFNYIFKLKWFNNIIFNILIIFVNKYIRKSSFGYEF